MEMKYRVTSLLIILFWTTLPSFSQGREASGKVVDQESGEGVSYATIYVNGTTIGTSSNLEGLFRISRISLPCELIVSHVSYELQALYIEDTTQLSGINFELTKRILAINELTVIADSARKDYLALFKDWFLGLNHIELGADILNDSALHFIPLANDQFEAYASQPLEVELPATGYRLKVDLVHFKLLEREEIGAYHCSILGYFYFEEILADSRRKQRGIYRKRVESYYNSRLHFCRSLYNNKLQENGYLFSRVCFEEVEEEDDLNSLRKIDFSQLYLKEETGNTVLILSDFRCPDFRISYYHRAGNKPVDLKHHYGHPSNLSASGLRFLKDTVRIYPSGRIPENSILFGGGIGDKGVATLLPEDYIPSMQ